MTAHEYQSQTEGSPGAMHLGGMIAARLATMGEVLKEQFTRDAGFEINVRYFCLDNCLPERRASQIADAFPEPARMRRISTFRERKYTSKSLDKFDPLLKEITFAFQDPAVTDVVERITGIPRQIPDPSLYAGGLSMMSQGHFLNPHIDNSHDASRRYYRTLNLLYYVTPGWQADYGGNLELWDRRVRTKVTIPSLFNRLVVMETTPWSWHSVSPVVADATRCCVSNYYFSPNSPTGEPYCHVTSFSARPEQPVRRAVSWVDSRLRGGVRRLFPRGLGRTDVYRGKDT